MVLEVDTSLQDLLHLHGRPLVAANRGADSAGLNQYRKVQKQQREALPARSLASQPTREACPLFCEVKGLSTATLPLAALALSVSPVLQ